MIIVISIYSEFNVVLLYNLKIIFYEKHFENTQVKPTTKLISFQTQCNDSTFVDKLVKSVFKSCRFDKYVSKSYLKITTINSFCFCWSNDYRNVYTDINNDTDLRSIKFSYL